MLTTLEISLFTWTYRLATKKYTSKFYNIITSSCIYQY